jgi:prepilin-type N-terminal cleavage/methylation domain-containing protein
VIYFFHMNTSSGFRGSRGFTLAEVLVAVAIVALIAGVTIASVRSSRNKAVDAETRKTLSEIALRAEAQEIAPGVVDYGKAFTASSAPAAITELATKLQLAPTDYQYVSTPTSYAIVFPLKKGGYYCVDSAGKATGKEVAGLFAATGPQNCETATRIVVRPDGWGDGSGGQPPVIAFVGGDFYDPAPDARDAGLCSPDGCVTTYDETDPEMDEYAIATLLGLPTHTDPLVTQYQINSRFSFPTFGFSATDPQDGDMTEYLEWDEVPTFRASNQSTLAEAQAILSYVNSLNGTTYSIGMETFGCNSSFVMYEMQVTDQEGNTGRKNFPVYACEINI